MLSYYEMLGVNFDADEKQIKSNFKQLLSIFHPDRINADADANEVTGNLKKVCDTLASKTEREKYNDHLFKINKYYIMDRIEANHLLFEEAWKMFRKLKENLGEEITVHHVSQNVFYQEVGLLSTIYPFKTMTFKPNNRPGQEIEIPFIGPFSSVVRVSAGQTNARLYVNQKIAHYALAKPPYVVNQDRAFSWGHAIARQLYASEVANQQKLEKEKAEAEVKKNKAREKEKGELLQAVREHVGIHKDAEFTSWFHSLYPEQENEGLVEKFRTLANFMEKLSEEEPDLNIFEDVVREKGFSRDAIAIFAQAAVDFHPRGIQYKSLLDRFNKGVEASPPSEAKVILRSKSDTPKF